MNEEEGKSFKLFSSCLLVQGIEASAIYDLERNEIYDIDNMSFEVLNDSKKNSINGLVRKNTEINIEELVSFFDSFVNSNLGFYTNQPHSFPELDLGWDSPYQITNCILRLKEDSFHIDNTIKQLDQLRCNAVQLQIETIFPIDEIEEIIKKFNKTSIRFIDLIVPYHDSIEEKEYVDLIEDYSRVAIIRICGADKDEYYTFNKGSNIHLLEGDLINNDKEIISKDKFDTNFNSFTEAQHYNLGLNRKVVVTSDGELKNYFSHSKSFGNIKDVEIKSIVSTENFQEKWMGNDQIEKCKECQYRYCCVSNSEIEIKDGLYHKVDQCDFDPKTNTWL